MRSRRKEHVKCSEKQLRRKVIMYYLESHPRKIYIFVNIAS